jgi:hypothetical protein
MLIADVSSGVFGLVGVFVGAAIAAGVDIWVQRRREKGERQAQERLLTSTTRLLLTDLKEAQQFLTMMENERIWLEDPSADRWVALWDQERKALAAALDSDHLTAVARAFLAIRLLKWNATHSEDGTALTDSEVSYIDNWQKEIARAIKVLETT